MTPGSDQEKKGAAARIFTAKQLRRIGVDIFVACGAPRDEAAVVADELVEASLMGLDSHGVMRYAQYANDALDGRIRPGAPVRVVKETPATAVVDCGFNFGPVGAGVMSKVVCEKAKTAKIACVVSRNGNHIGRLGSYVQGIAGKDLFGFAVANSSRHGHWVVPWGGREGRLATNPLAFAAPTAGGWPVILDMSTSMISEGKVRVLRDQRESVPPDCVQDAAGNPTTDPNTFYGPPRGTIRPFGSQLGYKGFGLSLLVEILGGIMAGCASSEDLPYVNGLCLIAIDPEAFCGRERFGELMEDLCAYVTGSPPAPGSQEVCMPGQLDFRTRERRLVEGIGVPEATWQQMLQIARRLEIDIDQAG